MESIRETMDRMIQINEAPTMYAMVEFEGPTQEIINQLQNAGWDAMSAQDGWVLLDSVSADDIDRIEDVVYQVNDGGWVDVKLMDVDEADRYM